MMTLDDEDVRPRFVVRDRDSKFTRDFDEVFRTEGMRVIKAPVRAPKARAHADRWVGSVRRECLDRARRLLLEKLSPARLRPLRRWLDPRLLEDRPDSARGERHVEPDQLA